MDVLRGNNEPVVVVLDVDNFADEVFFVMIVDESDCRDDRFSLNPFAFDKFFPYKVRNCFRARRVILVFDVQVKL